MRLPHKIILPAFLTSRFLVGIFVYLGHAQRAFLSPVTGGWKGVPNWWLNPWTTYDSKWFISIATSGYHQNTTPFFPLYPLLLKLGITENGMAAVGIAVSSLSFLAALYLFFLLIEMDYGRRVAKISVWLLAFFPTTAFFSAVYTESLFLCLLLASFYAARKNQWGLAGFCGLLTALTRNPGFLVFIALGLEYIKEKKPNERNFSDALAISMPLLGLIAVQSYFWLKFGSPLAGISSQQMYHRKPSLPWVPFWKDLVSLLHPSLFNFITFLDVISIIMAIVLMTLYFKTTRMSYIVLLVGIILMNLSYARTFPPYTCSTVRYLSTTFPFTLLLGLLISHSSSGKFIKGLECCLYLFICLLLSYLFGLKAFLG